MGIMTEPVGMDQAEGQKVISHGKVVRNKEDDIKEDVPNKPMTEAKEDGDTVKDAEVDHDDSDFKTVTSKKDRSEKIKEKPERRRKSRGARHRRDREKESAHREVKENSIEKEGEVEEEEEKEEKVTYVEAPIPKTNPWKKGKRTAAEEIEKKDVGKVR